LTDIRRLWSREILTVYAATAVRRDPSGADGQIRLVDHVDAGYVTLAQAATYLAVSSRTVRRWIEEQALPHYYIGGRQRGKLLFRRTELDRWARRFKGALATDSNNPLDGMVPAGV
jgi:excisionase family DNA binding protein